MNSSNMQLIEESIGQPSVRMRQSGVEISVEQWNTKSTIKRNSIGALTSNNKDSLDISDN